METEGSSLDPEQEEIHRCLSSLAEVIVKMYIVEHETSQEGGQDAPRTFLAFFLHHTAIHRNEGEGKNGQERREHWRIKVEHWPRSPESNLP